MSANVRTTKGGLGETHAGTRNFSETIPGSDASRMRDAGEKLIALGTAILLSVWCISGRRPTGS